MNLWFKVGGITGDAFQYMYSHTAQQQYVSGWEPNQVLSGSHSHPLFTLCLVFACMMQRANDNLWIGLVGLARTSARTRNSPSTPPSPPEAHHGAHRVPPWSRPPRGEWRERHMSADTLALPYRYMVFLQHLKLLACLTYMSDVPYRDWSRQFSSSVNLTYHWQV
jgi:hypothetical protein